MNVYFLVEGKRTESKVYPSWLSYLIPELRRVKFFDEVKSNDYYLISAGGYPSIIHDHIPNAIEDINNIQAYNYLVICLDADEGSVQDRVDEVNDILSSRSLHAIGAEIKVVAQNRCIETWFLGNRRVLNRTPTGSRLRQYLNHYDVGTRDPELMHKHPDFNTHAQFHDQYIKEILSERGLKYTKRNPGHVLDHPFLEQLVVRINTSPTHLSSLKSFFELCKTIRERLLVNP